MLSKLFLLVSGFDMFRPFVLLKSILPIISFMEHLRKTSIWHVPGWFRTTFSQTQSITGWWFGLEHGFYFPFHIWDVILPIDQLIFFRGVGIAPTRLKRWPPIIQDFLRRSPTLRTWPCFNSTARPFPRLISRVRSGKQRKGPDAPEPGATEYGKPKASNHLGAIFPK